MLRLCTLLAALSMSAWAMAGPGALDASFGVNGRIVVDRSLANEELLGFGLGPVGGYLGFASSFPANTPADELFIHAVANDGVDQVQRYVESGLAVGAAEFMPDGRLMYASLAGNGQVTGIRLARRLPNGNYDPSFNGVGYREMFLPAMGSRPTAMWVGASGRVVLAGTTEPDESPQFSEYDTFVMAVHPDGTLDTSFGSEGIALYSQSSQFETVNAVALDPQGRTLLCGLADVGGDSAATVMRFLPSGATDPSFGLLGLVMMETTNGADDSCQDIALHPDTDVVHIAANRVYGSPLQQAKRVVRFEDDGTYFVSPEVMGGDAPPSWTSSARLGFDVSGRLVMAGNAITNAASELHVSRFNVDLAVDTNFSSASRRFPLNHANLLHPVVRVRELLMDQGRIVVATQHSTQGSAVQYPLWSVLRLQGDAVFADGFE